MWPRRFFNIVVIMGLLLTGCGWRQYRVQVVADGQARYVSVPAEAATVAGALRQAEVTLGGLDRVEPASYTALRSGMQIAVIRGREELVEVGRLLPYERRVRRDATLQQGQTRIEQLGSNGVEVATYEVRYENDVEIKRTIVATRVLTPAVAEVLIVGSRGSTTNIPISGTLAYLAQGNAWLIRDQSSLKRALTFTGDLDGHVFSLSPDGRWLLFSRRPLGGEAGIGGPVNSLWLVRTDFTNAEPQYLNQDSVIWADWQPVTDSLKFAYATAARVPTPPGWRANNDLFLATLDAKGENISERQQLHPEDRSALYSWWGRAWRWSLDGSQLAWADTGSLGITTTGARTTRQFSFVPYEAPGNWVWTPQPAWHPDGSRYVAVIHGPPLGSEHASLAERFDLWLFPADGSPGERLEEQVGMWALPEYSAQGRLAYGRAEDPESSVSSRYRIVVTDRQGKNPRPLFPAAEQPGVDVPWLTWSPTGTHLAAVWQGDLYLIEVASGKAQPLTIEGGTSRVQWR
jgi:hypothetical protein